MDNNLSIVKIGGNVINDEKVLDSFLESFCKLEGPKILVHGGGRKASELSENLGIKVKMVDGRRITDADTIEIVTMVYGGLINKSIVAKLQLLGENAIGLTGADGNIIRAHKRVHNEIDYGFVGDIDDIDENMILKFLESGLTPVLAALTHSDGQMLNTNADTIASRIATAMSKTCDVELIYLFEAPGVMLDISDDTSVVNELDHNYYTELKEKGVISTGMIPKLDNAFDAISKGVRRIIIGSAQNFAKGKLEGTEIV